VLVNLIPDFLAILTSDDPPAAYHRYLETYPDLLDAYWRNYVLDPTSAPAAEVIRSALRADRADLRAMLAQVDVIRAAEETIARAEDVLQVDRPVDLVLMVGVGAANAGELVIGGKGIAFICVEHFTGQANPSSWALGLAPGLMPLWIAHEMAHAVRYTSPTSESALRRLVAEAGGYYDYWAIASRASLRELLINEGLAVHAARSVVPGLAAADYFGYPRRQYARLRELEAFLRRSVRGELDQAGLGLRLRYLSGGVSPAARLVQGKVVPERSGYYLGFRMVEALVQEVGIARALRSPAHAFEAAERAALGIRTA
jgi:hypothetical protein